jgi:hypothetical protein
MSKNFIDLKDEILRAYRVLDAGLAETQNKTDITEWFKEGLINATTYSRLIEFNKKTYYDVINGKGV